MVQQAATSRIDVLKIHWIERVAALQSALSLYFTDLKDCNSRILHNFLIYRLMQSKQTIVQFKTLLGLIMVWYCMTFTMFNFIFHFTMFFMSALFIQSRIFRFNLI